MFTSHRIHRAIIVAVPVFFCVLLLAATHDFVPDLLFRGSSLDGWHTLGNAQWKATDGEISASPNGAGGWLLLNKSYQDLEFYTDFRCTGTYDAGILFRAEKTSDGGLKGVYVSLNAGNTDSWHVTVSPEGKILSRTRLEISKVQFARIGNGPWTNGQAHVPGFSKLEQTSEEQKAEAAAAGSHATAAPARAGSGGRGAFPRPEIRAGEWNSVQVIVDADMAWITLNGRRSFPTGLTTDRMMGYGPIALYAGGSGEVRFKDISLKDLNRNLEPAEKVSSHFRMQRLDDFFYSWGVTTGDINHDGIPDVIAGPLFFVGPAYTERRAFTSARTYSPANNFPQGMVYFAWDFTGDGWTDILVVDSRPIYLYVNPKGEPRRWDRYNVVPTATSELELFRDIDGDGKPEVLFTGPGMVMAYAKPDPANPTGVWKVHQISEPGLAGPHGMGIGDINGDGRMDVVNSRGWWEQPANGAAEGPWKFHPDSFGTGGAEMGVYDVNGDGLNDIVTAIAAHGWGLAWFEQKRDSQGKISFVRHDIMGDLSTKNAGGVAFSEPHASGFADLDGDGIPDMVVGKRLYSHLESHLDPDPYGPAVLYWYRTVRNANAPGGAEFVPELIHNRSGVGSQIAISDLNGDGAADIVTSSSKGTFIFWNQIHKQVSGGTDRPMRFQLSRAYAVALLAPLSVAILPGQAQKDWRDYLGGPDSSHYSALKQINVSNISKLDVAWTYPTGDELSYTFSPLVIDNVAYVAAKNGSLVALDATNGKELWVHPFPSPAGTASMFSGITGQRGANYWESKDRSDRRIFVTTGGFLHAIDARTGKLVDSFADHGKLDLKIGIDRAKRPLASRSGGRIFENLIILGSSTGEGYLAPPGDVRAFDAVSGKLVWVFHTLPRPGEFGYDTWPKNAYTYMGGVDVWGEITVDEKRGIAYLPTASAKYELYGGDREGDNLFADCILALDARTGKYLWHFQTVHHDLWDFDPDAAPQLATVKHDGKTVDVVALASKNGFLYGFDRVTGKPLWPIEERAVPPSEVPGELASKTQPFPTWPPPFARQGMTAADMYTAFMTPEEIPWWRNRLSKARTGFFTPPGLIDTIQLPSVNGGALFFSTGADAANGSVYVLSKDMPSIMKLVPAGESTISNAGNTIPDRPRRQRARSGAAAALAATAEQRGRAVYEQNCQLCHGTELKGDRGPAIDTVVSRTGANPARDVITKGRGGMPAFASIPGPLMNDLIAFLSKPDAAPVGSAAPQAALNFAMLRSEPDYPEGVEPPPSRYKTGYGNEPYVITPPWSTITAYDLNTGKIRWKTPYGDLPQAGPSDKLRGNVYPKSGFVLTAGGLVLFAGNDSKLYALDKETGKVIFTKELPNGSLGLPAVYEANGREFILVAVSGGNPFPAGGRLAPGGVNPPATSKSYMAFAIPSKEIEVRRH